MSKLEMVINKVENKFKTDKLPLYAFYIIPNGSILDLGQDGHNKILKYLNQEGLEDYNELMYSNLLKEQGWIRGNNEFNYIDLTKEKPSTNQYISLLNIISNMYGVEISTPDNQRIQYGSDRTSDEIIKLIKRYYSSGTLLEEIV